MLVNQSRSYASRPPVEFAHTAEIPYFTPCTCRHSGLRWKSGKSHLEPVPIDVTPMGGDREYAYFTVGKRYGRGRDTTLTRLTTGRGRREHARVYASSRAPRRRLTDAYGTRRPACRWAAAVTTTYAREWTGRKICRGNFFFSPREHLKRARQIGFMFIESNKTKIRV